jgi:CRISPR-associated protein (TIGR02584 family)
MGTGQDGWREVLIVTGGMTPQVVTETVYALAHRAPDPLVPAKIVCVVTGGALDGFGKPLEAALGRLQCELDVEADWKRRASSSQAGDRGLYVEVPLDTDGQVIEDIRSDREAVRFGDLVSNIVRLETLDLGSRVHLSLAGGRKTMSFHAGMAMSLFGRPQDELSHVLVHPQEFEQSPEFWFPTTESLVLQCRDGAPRDARDCRIEPALIPFIRVRGLLPPGLSAQAWDFASYVRQLNAVLGTASASLELVTSRCRVRIGDIADFTLPNTEFALYQLMAEWKRDACEGAGPQGVGKDHHGWMTARMFECPEEYQPNPVARFLEIYDQTFRTSSERSDSMALMIDPVPPEPARRKLNVDAFAQWKARLQNALQDRLHHPALADRLGAPLKPVRVRALVGRKTGNRVVFGLRLDPHEIVIKAEAPIGKENTA